MGVHGFTEALHKAHEMEDDTLGIIPTTGRFNRDQIVEQYVVAYDYFRNAWEQIICDEETVPPDDLDMEALVEALGHYGEMVKARIASRLRFKIRRKFTVGGRHVNLDWD
jgi:hypothetical protein